MVTIDSLQYLCKLMIARARGFGNRRPRVNQGNRIWKMRTLRIPKFAG